MASNGLDVGLESTGVGEVHLDAGGDRSQGRVSSEIAVSTTVWQVVGYESY